MTDQPGRQPEERLPAPRPSSAPVPAERFSAPPSAHRNDLTPERAARIVRQSANARWVGFLAVTIVGLFVIVYYFYELGLPGGLSGSRADGPGGCPAGHRGPARLQHLRGELRAVPRRQRRGRQGPDAQPPGQAVRAPEPRLHPDHAPGRRPVRVRQPEQPHARVVEHRDHARTAQLQADPGPDRVHPVLEGLHLHRARSLAVRARDRPHDRQGEDVHGLGRPELQARAGCHAVPGLLVGRVHPTGRLRHRRRLRIARHLRVPGSDRHRPPGERAEHRVRGRFAHRAGRCAVPDRVQQQGRGDPAQHRDQGREREHRLQGRHHHGPDDHDVRRAGAQGRVRTRSRARCTRT